MYQAGTLSGNPVAVAAGLAALNLIEAGEPYPGLRAKAETLQTGLRDILGSRGVPATVNRVESLLSVFFSEGRVTSYADAKASDQQRYASFFHAMLADGVYLPPSGYEAWFLSTAHGDEDLDRTLEAAAKAAERLG